MATKTLTHWLSHAWASEEDILFRYMEVAEEYKMPQDFDTLVGVGVSGAVIVPTLARLLGVNFAIVRKENDGSHGWNKVEGMVGSTWLFVDDLVSSGATVRRVQRLMRDNFPNSAPVAVPAAEFSAEMGQVLSLNAPRKNTGKAKAGVK